jgi:hypothetical protein
MFEHIPREEVDTGYMQFSERMRYAEALQEKIKGCVAEINNSLRDSVEGLPDGVALVSETGNINMQAYWTKHGGPYKKTAPKDGDAAQETSVTADEQFVEERKREWGDEHDLQAWEQRQQARYGFLWEMVVFVMLHKALKETCVVVRAAAYDDIENGVDILIFDKHTGELLCAFDEVVDSMDGVDVQKKNARAQRKNDGRGFTVKYGIDRGEHGGMVRAGVHGVRGVPIDITREHLKQLLEARVFESETLTPQEKNLLQVVSHTATRVLGESGEAVCDVLRRASGDFE